MITEQLITQLKQQIQQLIHSLRSEFGGFQSKEKSDGSPVTELDLRISELIRYQIQKTFPRFHFYCEENHHELRFPAIILDPIDGTRELLIDRGESAVSLALIDQNESFGWIYNPFTGFELRTDQLDFASHAFPNHELTGLISRSEWEEGLAPKSQYRLTPRGSIAFKLALLAAGCCDFVLTMRSKNIWDIAAGTLLCQQRGICLYSKKGEVTHLDTPCFKGPLIWCHPNYQEKLTQAFLA